MSNSPPPTNSRSACRPGCCFILPACGRSAFLAIEAGTAPWPAIPDHGKETAGPFFLVWQDARRGEISSEYWVYKLASLEVTDSPYKRWPALNVADDLPATHPARRGLDRYVTLCISCHRFNGAGEGEMGPDLAKPMNPVDYFQPAGLPQVPAQLQERARLARAQDAELHRGRAEQRGHGGAHRLADLQGAPALTPSACVPSRSGTCAQDRALVTPSALACRR